MTKARSWSLGAAALLLIPFGAFHMGCATTVSPTEPGGGGAGQGANGQGANADGGRGGEGGTCVPGTEICDGADNDCDDLVDAADPDLPDGCECTIGEEESCYSGRAGTAGVGACKEGSHTCGDDGKWGPCEGEVIPGEEVCNNTDDDCDNATDELDPLTCGVGACAVTTAACADGQPQICTPLTPSQEVCDGIDNDCDQLTDESDPAAGQACDSGLPGVCQQGKLICSDVMGTPTLVCTQDVMPSTETCDNLDNDCNGTIDDVPGSGGACGTGQPGVCQSGIVACDGMGSLDCIPIVAASPEICDGLDNDCDGTSDDGNPESGGACNTGQPGACQAGTINCVMGGLQCVPNATAQNETCNNVDDNCNGAIDEGNPGGGVACGCGGTTQCMNGAVACIGGPTTYFTDDFSMGNAKGWTLDTTWQIGPAAASSGCGFGNDPATDHTSTADNGIAGVNIGSCYPTTTHPDYCITSPNIDTAAAASVYFSYWRHLHSDYPGYMTHTVQVSPNGGGSWTTLYAVPAGQSQNDTAWTNVSFNVTAYKAANMRVRFCYAGTSTGIISGGGWNIDDVLVSNAPCP